MARRSVMPQKKKRAAPRKDKGTLIALPLQPGLLARVDRWAASQTDDPSRPEAIRRLVGLGLAIAPLAGVRTEKAAQAAEMASQELDRLGDSSATDEPRYFSRQLMTNCGRSRGRTFCSVACL
jgi:hypothetical protein